MTIRYKYTKAKHVYRLLSERRIKVTTAREFNDPFELLPNGRGTFLGLHKKHSFLDAAGLEKVKEIYEKADEQTRERLGRRYGVLCLSKSATAVLMWAHYSESLKGCAVGIDVDHRCFSEKASKNEQVRYTRARKYYYDPDGRVDEEQDLRLLVSKQREWKYEKEHRLVFQMEHLKQERIDGLDCYFYCFEPDAIREVVFGYRVSDACRRKIESLLGPGRPYEHVRQFVAVPDGSSYQIVLEKYGEECGGGSSRRCKIE